ncbi:MAG: hypothetical protein QNJ05_09475 [Woeseiaceae bacterium]|nr:hypothetical protein [Woeseiaceae bacterium]
MINRVIAGFAGVGAVLFAFTWPNYMPALAERLPSPILGYITVGAVTLGVYLMFFGLTGDWLPRLTRLRDRR